VGDTFGDRLFAISRAFGYRNNTEFAARIGTKPNEVQRLFEKMFRPRREKIEKIATRLAIPVEALTRDVRTADDGWPTTLPEHVAVLLPPDAQRTIEVQLRPDVNGTTVHPLTQQLQPVLSGMEGDLLRTLAGHASALVAAVKLAKAVEKYPEREEELARAVIAGRGGARAPKRSAPLRGAPSHDHGGGTIVPLGGASGPRPATARPAGTAPRRMRRALWARSMPTRAAASSLTVV
jgi:hypothetical protein